jgi:hypothetical protein
MKLTTWDIHKASICLKRYYNEPIKEEAFPPTRELIKRIVLLKALGRERKWTIKGLASAWDGVFWQGKEVNQDNINASVKGVISLRKIYNRLPENYDAYSCKEIYRNIDGGVYLYSSGDFFLVTDRGIEIWIYKKTNIKEMKRSLLPAAELRALEGSVRAYILSNTQGARDPLEALRERVSLVFYYSGNGMRPSIKKVWCERNDRAVDAICDLIRRRIEWPSYSDNCKDCGGC